MVNTETAMAMEVFDLHGRMVEKVQLKKGSNPIDLGHLPNGLYYLKGEHGALGKVMVSK